MSGAEKAEVLDKVASSGLPKRRILGGLGVPRSTYYRWLRRKDQQGLEDDVGGGNPPWNKLTSQEIDYVLSAAREMPELSPRQLAAWTTDNQGFSVSESTVYRILRREGLVKRAEMQLAAGKEYHRKTTGPHQMWATDASYCRVVGWGYYYMVTVMDDYSRFILAHRLQRDMTSDSFIEVVQEAVDRTGMDQIPITDRTRLLSDNGPGYVSRAFRDYLAQEVTRGMREAASRGFFLGSNASFGYKRIKVKDGAKPQLRNILFPQPFTPRHVSRRVSSSSVLAEP